MRSARSLAMRPLLACILALPLLVHASPVIERWETGNGARVYFVAAHELPIVNLEVVFDAGAARDAGHPGLAKLTNGLLTEGAGGLSADAIAERFAGLGAEVSNSSLRDMALVSLRSLNEPDKLQPAVTLLSLILRQPDFPAGAIERVRRQMLVSLRLVDQSPGRLASRAYYAGLYGEHPYASPPLGTTESVKALTRDQISAYYQRYYVARNAVVAIVGDLDRVAARALAETVVGGLPAGAHAAALPAVADLPRPRTRRIDHPSTQTHLLMGQPGVSRKDPDFYPFYVGNHVLGGSGLVSLLSEEVREKRGLSYSVYSSLIAMHARGPFTVGLQTRSDQAGEALKVARETLRRFVAEGPSEGELRAAKQNITGGFPLRLDSNAKIAQNLSVIGFYDLPLDYLDRFPERVEAVTREQVRDAFRRRVHPERLLTVLVGQGLPSSAGQGAPDRVSSAAEGAGGGRP